MIGCYTAGVPIKDMVVVDGGMAHHPEGAYYFRKDRKWIKAGETPQDVIDASPRLATAPEQPIEEKPKLWQVAMRWLESYNVGKAERTKQAMELVLKNFLSVTKVPTIRDITADHVRAYWQWEVDNSPTKSYRTAHNRVTSLKTFLKENSVDIKWKIPPFVEETPEVYEDDEIEALLGACDPRHKAAYSTMLKALMREKEAVYLTWDRVDVKRSVIYIKAQPQYGWKPKKHHERAVTVLRDLINMIDALPRTGLLVFGKEDGSPDMHLLRDLKAIAKSCSLDPDHCWLHKFRATGCTKLLQSGMPLADTMKLGGWRDLASVQRYMGLLNHDRLSAAVEAAWA